MSLLQFCLVKEHSDITVFTQDLYKQALRMRTERYVREEYVSLADLTSNGTDVDKFDDASAHIVAFQGRIGSPDCTIVGQLRIIWKRFAGSLPIEILVPDAFPDGTAENAMEVSRLVVEHSERRIHKRTVAALYTAASEYMLSRGADEVYVLLTESLYRSLGGLGLVQRALTPALYIPEINSTKVPCEISTSGMSNLVKTMESNFVPDVGTVQTMQSSGFVVVGL